ncbi:DNA repair protein RecN [Pelagibaculum spongiae]|uniref:DNA repair protein RecN n=1 Tax=Pelagibaculum spongiae TaxID=2080658 RepID=A0A2V1GY29_9GAMM|nr:DNA repair protein RecN [Pelagibaculum spongiae]PVZ71994.1 DNA repair protein RecN [Pelagibaculum spongiae]
MLKLLNIQNFAIIDHLELDLQPGLTVLTGETGAGKSILLDALTLACGGRLEQNPVRPGAEKAEICASFELQQLPEAMQWLKDNEMDSDHECVLRRVITPEGRSRSWINGSLLPLAKVRDFSRYLLDIHGQHQHYLLLKREAQSELLDHSGKLLPQLQLVEQAWSNWQSQLKQLKALQNSIQTRGQRIEFLNFQLVDFNQLQLQTDEIAQLEQEQKKLSSVSMLATTAKSCGQQLDSSQRSLVNEIERLQAQLEPLKATETQFEPICQMLDSAHIQLAEAASELNHYSQSCNLDPQRLKFVDQRLSEIYSLAKRHRCAPELLNEIQQQLNDELIQLEQVDLNCEQLAEQIAALEQHYMLQAQQLSQSRQATAEQLSRKVSRMMGKLDLAKGQFAVALEAKPAGPSGLEQAEFLCTTNPGQPMGPISKIASGGELSRISLALQVSTIDSRSHTTLGFDEVDVGIGGATAETVGELLQELGKQQQVLCITHQPQVASRGDQHLKISKRSDQKNTYSRFDSLSSQQRIEEIARMLGGRKITRQGLQHATTLLEDALRSE